MKGDFTRNTFDPTRHFTRVLMQQGRVQLDADWNEQAAITLHYLQALAADLIGPHGGPGTSFKIEPTLAGQTLTYDFAIDMGHYYVGGLLCENDQPCAYTRQPDFPLPDAARLENLVKQNPSAAFLVFLDVWERHVTYMEDDAAGIREVALGGPDTATRAHLVWQVRIPLLGADDQKGLQALIGGVAKQDPATINQLKALAENVRQKLSQPTSARLRARARGEQPQDDPCTISPEAKYTGLENQLYRVEIHRGGAAYVPTEDKDIPKTTATFKWSRENGSVIFPIRTVEGNVVTLDNLGRDDRLSLHVDDWVEIVDDNTTLQGTYSLLYRVTVVEPVDMTVTLDVPSGVTLPAYSEQSTTHPLLRRWDQQGAADVLLDEGAIVLTESDGEDEPNWIMLEDGVEIQFPKLAGGASNDYRAGDYWLIPARTATADVEWPDQKNAQGDVDTYPNGDPIPAALPPRGVTHYFAPLAFITVDAKGIVNPTDLRRTFIQLWS
jgi:hypothetical protein